MDNKKEIANLRSKYTELVSCEGLLEDRLHYAQNRGKLLEISKEQGKLGEDAPNIIARNNQVIKEIYEEIKLNKFKKESVRNKIYVLEAEDWEKTF